MLGIRNIFKIAANVVFTSNVVPATVGLTSPIAANETQKLRAWVPFITAATGGIRIHLTVPAGGNTELQTYRIIDASTETEGLKAFQADQVVTNPLANAGLQWIEVEAVIVNGAVAGNVDILFAQNTSDVNSLTILANGVMEVVKY